VTKGTKITTWSDVKFMRRVISLVALLVPSLLGRPVLPGNKKKIQQISLSCGDGIHSEESPKQPTGSVHALEDSAWH
jgi:hypothetical protein